MDMVKNWPISYIAYQCKLHMDKRHKLHKNKKRQVFIDVRSGNFVQKYDSIWLNMNLIIFSIDTNKIKTKIMYKKNTTDFTYNKLNTN